MKKIIASLVLLSSFCTLAQRTPPPLKPPTNTTPGQYFDTVLDKYGNSYPMTLLNIQKDYSSAKTGSAMTSTLLCTTGIFNLYFESGSGMEITSNATHNQRRDVICRVFQDVSNFLETPLKDAGNNTKINIWVRDITEVGNVPASALGLATAFYSMPGSVTPNFGGIVDNEIWKTIHTGVDTFNYMTMPMGTTSPYGTFYHGQVAFNFNNGAISWNTNMAIASPVGKYDLYSVALHEVTHALGFESVLNENGTSRFGNNFNYYTRYDQLLKNSANTQPVLIGTSACSTMYNYVLNSAVGAGALYPGCTDPSHVNQGQSIDDTNCSNALRFVSGNVNVPVYTPTCVEGGSSFSHFEDKCIVPSNNNGYFAMSNAQSNGTGGNPVNTKRFLRPEERLALCDIGYAVKNAYGNSSTLNGTITYAGANCAGTVIGGVNDGINTNGTYAFIGNINTNIALSGLLANDYPLANSSKTFECLQDVYDSSATFNNLASLSGNAGTAIAYKTNVAGIHLLRYVPVLNGKKGNITYVYVYVKNPTVSCASPSACNLVMNGDFEEYSALPDNINQIARACGWETTHPSMDDSDYFHALTPAVTLSVPCNQQGYQTSFNNVGNGYGGLYVVQNHGGLYSETIKTKLASPLLANTTYQLRFNLTLAESTSSTGTKLQAYLSTDDIAIANFGPLPVNAQGILLTSSVFTTSTTNWDTVTITFTTGSVAGQQYLYLGGITTAAQFTPATVAGTQVGGCPYYSTVCSYGVFASEGWGYYFIDNVRLLSLANATLNLPASLCAGQGLTNLASYLTAVPTNGVFSGPGVTSSGGQYNFNATAAGTGIKTITYSYTNSNGCNVTISDTIEVTSNCCPCLYSTSVTMTPQLDDTWRFNVVNSNPLCTGLNLRYTWTHYNGSTTVNTTGVCYSGGQSITVLIELLSGTNTVLCSITRYYAASGGTANSRIVENPKDSGIKTFEVTPNPSDGLFTLHSDAFTGRVSITVVDINGKIVHEAKDVAFEHERTLDLHALPTGLYVVRITGDGMDEMQKIIKN